MTKINNNSNSNNNIIIINYNEYKDIFSIEYKILYLHIIIIQDSGISGVENVHIYYSVNEGDQIILMLPYQSSNILTDIVLPGIQNGDDVSVQISVENASSTTARSDKIQIRMYYT